MRLDLAGIAGVAAAAFVLSMGLVRLIREAARQRGVLDMPNERSSHRAPTPRLGGIGILVAIVVPVAGAAMVRDGMNGDLVVVLALAAAVSLLSLRDDLQGLPALARLFVHATTAALTVAWLGPVWPGSLGLDSGMLATGVAIAVTVLWIAGFLNAFNFMDGIDGIAAGQAVVAAAAWAVAGWWLSEPLVVVLGVAIAAAAAGFLVYNWSPATIFMGDAGSALLGFLLAVLPLLQDSPVPVFVVLLPVWPFVFDTAFTLLRRAGRGENLLAAHRSHLYQRLTQSGWTHAQTAGLYVALALAGAVTAVPMAIGRLATPVPGMTVVAAGSLLLWWLVVSSEARLTSATPTGGTRGSGRA